MFKKNSIKQSLRNIGRFFLIFGLMTGSVFLLNSASIAQTPQASPTPDEVEVGGFKIKSSIELGYRYRDLNGSENKYRSDLNYKSGLRVFNSSISLESKNGKNRFFDSALINSSGWGADPSGFLRFNIEKIGGYRFTSNIRRVKYFNSLNNHAQNQHNTDTENDMGDFDVTVFPQSDKLRLNFGYSFSNYSGPGVWTARAYRDDFPVTVDNDNKSQDFRAGIQGKLAGFNLSFTQGYRLFNDKTKYFLKTPTIGNTTTDPATFAGFTRSTPVRGEAFFSIFDVQRTFAKKLDMTVRLIYSDTQTRSSIREQIAGRDNNNNIVVLDDFYIFGKAKRPQTRGDFGLTYRATDKFTVSNTFSFDKFSVNGGENLFESLIRRNPAGTASLPTTVTRSSAYRVNDYQRFVNTVEGDYQFNKRVSFHLGYRYTRRKIDVTGFDFTETSAPSATNPRLVTEEEENNTNTIIAGMKIKPTKNWVMFWDIEHGTADNVFTRVENYEFTNFRWRNRLTFNRFAFNFSAISKDNTNPAQSSTTPPVNFGAITKSRIFSGSLDWTPVSQLSFSSGYTYTHQTSDTAILIPVNVGRIQGFSQFFVRDHYGFLDVVAKPAKRLSIFASYRISKDLGQGDRFSNVVQNIINSYPMQFQSPEVRASIRLNKNIDWNIGYQYFNYRERFQSAQNYRAHLPYTSLTIYLGGGDR